MGLLEGKHAIVTGAASPRGLGKATARLFAEHGARVAILDLDEAAAKAAAADLPGEGHIGLACDVTDKQACEKAVADLERLWGRIDVLVNNAGHNSQRRKWDELDPNEFDAVIAANLTGTFNCIHAVLPQMRSQGGGRIVNISSVAGKQVNPDGGVAYTIAKHGVHIMAKMLNQTELANGIRACVIAPAGVSTRAHDWRPEELRQYMLQPEDVARAVRFAVEQPAHSTVFEIEMSWSPV